MKRIAATALLLVAVFLATISVSRAQTVGCQGPTGANCGTVSTLMPGTPLAVSASGTTGAASATNTAITVTTVADPSALFVAVNLFGFSVP